MKIGIQSLVVAASVARLCAAQYNALRSALATDGHFPGVFLSRHPDSHNELQRPLGDTDDTSVPIASDVPPFKAGQFTRVPQDNSTCATYGESQWAGTIDVTDTHRLFYWFFDSRNDPANDPVVLWMNGGPGGSSMMGLFTEMGPCWLEPEANATVPNPWSWNNNASLLFIDQPAGVGFASLAEGAPVPETDMDGAEDFQVFLNTFFEKVFPEKAHLPLHITAESYGGHFAPTYLNHIMLSRSYDSSSAFRGNIASIILVDALLDFGSTCHGVYELLCSDFRSGGKGILNETACDNIRLNMPESERLRRSCALSYDGYECWGMMSHCWDHINQYYDEKIMAGERNPFNIHVECPNPPDCDDPRKGNFTRYLNQDHIKAGLDFPPSFTFHSLNSRINEAYTENRVPFKPTTTEVGALLDAYLHPELGTDIRLLVLQGNNDYICNTPGAIFTYDNLLWSGMADYRIAPWAELPDGVAVTGMWKGTADQRLVFVGVDGAGHTVPGDVREGSYHIMQRWIESGWEHTQVRMNEETV